MRKQVYFLSMKAPAPILTAPDHVDDVLFNMTHFIRSEPVTVHSHDVVEITVTFAGQALHSALRQTRQLNRGDVFIILPGAAHELPECREWEHYNISCSPDILDQIGVNLSFIHGLRKLFRSAARVIMFHMHSMEFNDAGRLIRAMFETYETRRQDGSGAGNLRAYFAILLCLLAQSYSRHSADFTPEKRLDKLTDYINQHYQEEISLRDLANVACLSESQLVRVFRREFGITPWGYVTELRFAEARRLLSQTRLSVAEIANECGFRDGNYMTHFFRKRYGMSPTQARKNRFTLL